MSRTTALVLSLAALAAPLSAADLPHGASLSRWSHEPPGIRIWTSHGEVYRRGERVRVYFRTERDAYVLILRADTDGRLRILFPRVPSENNYVRGGASYDVPNFNQHDAFVVDDDPGVGYVFAIAAQDQFQWDAWTNADHWQLDQVSDNRIHGDPYTSLEELVQHVLPEGYADLDTHLLPYHVEQHYDYPRFVCYDCHSYVGFSYWNPYRYYCPRFTLFVYNDPYYFYPSYWYPTRYYGGTRVVYVRPGQREGRYIFKARDDQSTTAIAYRDRRTDESAGGRRPADRGVRGADLGGVGSVAVPGTGRRLAPPDGGPGGGGERVGGREPADRSPVMGGGVPSRRPVSPGGTTDAPTVNRGVTPDDGGRRRVPGEPGAGPTLPPQPREVTPPSDQGRRGLAPDPYSTRPTPREPLGQPAEPPVTRGLTRPEWRGNTSAPKEPRSPDARPEPRGPDARPQPRAPDTGPQPRAPDARPEPRAPDTRAQPREQPRAEPRQQPRAEPRQEPRSAPAPRAEPQRSPAPAHQPSPSPTLTRRRP